jgi:hypothetical protein
LFDACINGWAIVGAVPSAVRRDIFVETNIKTILAPLGAAYSAHIPNDVAPTELLKMMASGFYKDASPTGFTARQRAQALLAAAQRAVEIAVEDSETAALAYLKKEGV